MAGAVVLAALAVGAWSFAWPESTERDEYAIGPVNSFARGSVTTYLWVAGGLRELPVGEVYDERPPGYPGVGLDLVHVVRYPDGDVNVFSGAAPFGDSTVLWYRTDSAPDRDDYVGLFAEGRRGSRWALDGTRLFGPAPRGLDQYGFRIRADGVLVLDLSRRTEGASGPLGTIPYDVTSPDWPTPGWPSR
ncbi:MAG: hypothetical protein O3A10_02550 [Chloroflexi bacterium]|nr:hypothetical protein [Chloroflexota bacterium]MDA1145215.1 hypothetical protein [Chloroflexota bacterium]